MSPHSFVFVHKIDGVLPFSYEEPLKDGQALLKSFLNDASDCGSYAFGCWFLQVCLEAEEKSETDEFEHFISFVELPISWEGQFSEAFKHEKAVDSQNLTIFFLILNLLLINLTNRLHIELETVLELTR